MTPLSHTQARQWLQLAADGLLNAPQQADLDAHLRGCAECRAYADELKQLEHALRAALVTNLGQPSLSPQAVENLVDKLKRNVSNGPGGNGSSATAGLPKILGIFLAVILAALALLYGPSILAGGVPTATPTEDQAATPTSTHTVNATATASLTPTPVELVLIAVPVQNLNCREGNSSQFEIADTLYEGEVYIPNARGNDELWVRFTGPVTQLQCWAFVDNLALLVNDVDTPIEQIPESLLPFAPYPPTPTPSPTPTFTPEPSETPVPSQSECSDGIDNDNDRYVDMKDPQCRNPQDNSESKP
jgi:hypothetical protein